MRTRLVLQIGICLLVAFACLPATGQSNQEWMGIKSKCGLSSGLAYNDWVASGSPCNAGTPAAPAAAAPATLNPALANAAQSVGYALGQELGKAIFGDPAAAAAAQQRNLAAQRSALAAQQLSNSGLYLLKNGKSPAAFNEAKNEFQQALNITPNDANILHYLAMANQKLNDIAVAAKNSGALAGVLGDAPPASNGLFGDQLTHFSVPSPNASTLSLVNLDANVVDLRNATSASTESLKSQLTGVFAKTAPASVPPDPLVVLPEARDIDLLFQPPQVVPSQWPGPQRPANSSKLVNPIDAEEQTKAQVQAADAEPGGFNDLMQQKLMQDALDGLVIKKPIPAVPASPAFPDNLTEPAPSQPHN